MLNFNYVIFYAADKNIIFNDKKSSGILLIQKTFRIMERLAEA